MPRRSGFSLIELMIVIAIIGILVAVALPQFSAMTEDSKKAKAKHDTSELAKQVAKFCSLEGKTIEALSELKGKYVSNLDSLRDPWGAAYGLDVVSGAIYSRGPDGKHAPARDGTWSDDIATSYIGPLALVECRLQIDPDLTTDAATAYDRLFLVFNKGVSCPAYEIELGPANAATNDRKDFSPFEDGDARAGRALRWYEGARPGFKGGHSPFPEGTIGALSPTTDARVICVSLPPGFTEVFKTTTWLNLTGARNDPNPFFLGPTGLPGAESTGSPVRIQTIEGAAYELVMPHGGRTESDEKVAADPAGVGTKWR